MDAHQLILDLGRDPAFDIEDFLVSPSNLEAFGLIDRWPDWPAHMLVLTGPPGSGKSHLAAIWARHSGATIIRGCDGVDPSAVGANAAILMEDCDRAQRSEATLFHLINLMRESGGWLLLTARTRPDQWNLKTADVVSRLRVAPMVQIGRPNPELLRAVLIKLFADRQIRIEDDIVSYATLHLEQSLDAVTRFVAAVDEAALSSGRKITRGLASSTIALLQRDDG